MDSTWMDGFVVSLPLRYPVNLSLTASLRASRARAPVAPANTGQQDEALLHELGVERKALGGMGNELGLGDGAACGRVVPGGDEAVEIEGEVRVNGNWIVHWNLLGRRTAARQAAPVWKYPGNYLDNVRLT
jgi:hypothetical protein